MIQLRNHQIRHHNGQPHFVLAQKDAMWSAPAIATSAQPHTRALGRNGDVHQFFFDRSDEKNVELFAWHSLPASADPATHEALRFLPGLYGRPWICAVTGCKEKSVRFSADVRLAAWTAGKMVSELGWTVLTGGLSGVMSRAAEGARSVGGLTVGILPGGSHQDANPFIDIALPSGIGFARNYLIAGACELMIALPGGTGTLEEMCFALDFEREVISWGSHEVEQVRALPLSEPNRLRDCVIEIMKNRFQKINTPTK